MSKIGKQNINIPEKVSVALSGTMLNIEGPLGKKSLNIDTEMFDVNIKGKEFLQRRGTVQRRGHQKTKQVVERLTVEVIEGEKEIDIDAALAAKEAGQMPDMPPAQEEIQRGTVIISKPTNEQLPRDIQRGTVVLTEQNLDMTQARDIQRGTVVLETHEVPAELEKPVKKIKKTKYI